MYCVKDFLPSVTKCYLHGQNFNSMITKMDYYLLFMDFYSWSIDCCQSVEIEKLVFKLFSGGTCVSEGVFQLIFDCWFLTMLLYNFALHKLND